MFYVVLIQMYFSNEMAFNTTLFGEKGQTHKHTRDQYRNTNAMLMIIYNLMVQVLCNCRLPHYAAPYQFMPGLKVWCPDTSST